MENNIGKIHIADEVVATIAGTAALEIDGVGGMDGVRPDIASYFGKRVMSKGIKVKTTNGQTAISIKLHIKQGYHIPEISQKVQENVKIAVEVMTGLDVTEVNILVGGLVVEKEKARG